MSAIKAAGRRTGHELKARSSEEQKRREPAEEPETQAHGKRFASMRN